MKKRLVILLAIVMVLSCVFAACSENTFSVTFDAQNGTEPTVVKFDSNFALPINPTNGDKVFGGWYTDKDCTDGNEWTVPSELDANVTVYAKWTDAVTPPPVTISLNKTQLTLTVGGSEDLVATVSDGSAVTWSSSDNSIATVDQNGKVTAVAEGSATITAAVGEVKATCQVTVEKATPTPDTTLATILAKYVDIDSWNFRTTYVLECGGKYVYNDVLKFIGENFAWEFEEEDSYGNLTTYTDYVWYDEVKDQYVYYYDNGDGTYNVYYETDDEDDFYEYYLDAPWLDLSELTADLFTKNNDCYVANDPATAGNAILGDWGDDCTFTALKLYVADGYITKIVATQKDTSEYYAGTYTFILEFSQFGEIVLSAPDLDGGDSGDGGSGSETPDPDVPVGESKTTVIDVGSFALSGTAYGWYNWSKDEISGFAYLYSGKTSSIQMTTKKQPSYYLASITATPGAITSITVKLASEENGPTSYEFEVLTSNSAFTQVDGAPTTGTSQGTKTATLDGTTWTISGTDTYFCIICKTTKKAVYIENITVVYGGGSGSGSSSGSGSGGGSGSGSGSSTGNVMPEQTYDKDTFDNENLQDKLLEYEKSYDRGIGLPSTGKPYNALVVPVQFGNKVISDTALNNLNIAFNGTSEQTGWESVSTYYQKSSFGKLNLSFDIWNYNIGTEYGKNFTAKYAAKYYENSQNGSDLLLKEVLAWLDDMIDFSKYDTNGDGCIDAVYLIYDNDVDYDNGNFWWAYVTWYQGEETYDGKYAYYYLFAGFDFMMEDVNGGGITESVIEGLKVNAVTYIHETGHLLGLDDYYDYSSRRSDGYSSVGCNEGLGGADIMDATQGDHNKYSKIMLGWMEPTIVTESKQYTIDLTDDDTSNDCFLIFLDSNNSYFCEYLLIDLYSATRLNELHAKASGTYLYDGASFGARIYHVSSAIDNPYSENEYGSFTNNNNSVTDIALIKLVEADGETSKSTQNYGAWASASDLWQTGGQLSEKFANYKRNDGKLINFDIVFDSVTETTATFTVTFTTAA